MTATAAQIAQVRRMVAEPTTTTYSDALIQGFIEAYPKLDERGELPYTWDTSTEPPTQEANDNWIPTYDLNAAAADIWEEKAAGLAALYDFSDAGATYHRSQAAEMALKMARKYRSRRSSKTIKMIKSPKESEDELLDE